MTGDVLLVLFYLGWTCYLIFYAVYTVAEILIFVGSLLGKISSEIAFDAWDQTGIEWKVVKGLSVEIAIRVTAGVIFCAQIVFAEWYFPQGQVLAVLTLVAGAYAGRYVHAKVLETSAALIFSRPINVYRNGIKASLKEMKVGNKYE